jgi:elongation factor Ts
MEITAKMVADLRERSGAPMMDCKRALAATQGDVELAFDHLRKAGLKSADKKLSRSMGEGRVQAKVAADKRSGVMVALTCETDFVAKTDEFQALLSKLCDHAAKHFPATAEAMLAQKLLGSSETVQDAIRGLIGKLGENMQVAQIACYQNPKGYVGGYLHHNGKVGALVSLSTDAKPDKAEPVLKQLGMHISASKPSALTRADVAPELIAREEAVYRESEDVKSKPADKQAMILKGKLEKFFESAALLEQPWVHDPKQNVLKALAAALGPAAKVERFALFQVGA